MIPEINLLPKFERRGSVLYKVFIGSLILLLLAIAALVYTYIQTKSDLADAEESHNRLINEQMVLTETLADLNTDGSDSLEELINFTEFYIIPTSALINELFVLLPEQAYISDYTYTFGEIEIETQFETKSDMSLYVRDLLLSDYTTDVKLNEVTTFELDTEKEGIENTYTTMPRYNATYSLEVDIDVLKGEMDINE